MVGYKNSVPWLFEAALWSRVSVPIGLALPLIAINFVVTVTGTLSIVSGVVWMQEAQRVQLPLARTGCPLARGTGLARSPAQPYAQTCADPQLPA